jgi:hypothetical protein
VATPVVSRPVITPATFTRVIARPVVPASASRLVRAPNNVIVASPAPAKTSVALEPADARPASEQTIADKYSEGSSTRSGGSGGGGTPNVPSTPQDVAPVQTSVTELVALPSEMPKLPWWIPAVGGALLLWKVLT